jgi:peptidoglycan/xylan/chitin deacetylase (PgdA/CDA1 family)
VKIKLALIAAAALALSACGSSASEKTARPHKKPVHRHHVSKRLDPSRVRANELGVIPVLMYHRIVKPAKSVYDTTPAQFRHELLELYRQGYRPIRAKDLVRGMIDVPAGKTPVVLTFDDSTASQFALLPNGKVDPHTAVGMLLAFAKNHPGFTPTATFYVISSMFESASGDGAHLLDELAGMGFELGDHTYDHANLGVLDAAGVQREIVRGERMINDAVPEEKVFTLALPYGVYPRKRELALRGSWDGQAYSYDGVFTVGSEPAPSPFSIKFDPLSIPRIESQPLRGDEDLGSGYWLNFLRLNPEQRFVSDGDPRRISFPRIFAGAVAARYRGRANPY